MHTLHWIKGMVRRRQFAVACVLLFVHLVGTAKVREESNALELLYESRIRSALNTMLRPNEYSVVVAVEISQDAKLLDQVESELDKMGLPGVPGIPAGESMPFVNKLHELKNRVEVHLVLDDAIQPEKEAAAVSLVRMKLHLNEEAGDNLVVVKSNLVPKEPKPEEPKAPPVETLPELTWRMWALVMIVSLLAIAALMFMVTRKRKEEKSVDMKKQWPELSFDQPFPTIPVAQQQQQSEKEDERDAEAEAAAAAAAQYDKELVEFYEKKKFILEIATKYPSALSQAATEYFQKGNQEQTLLAFESLGWDIAKSLFASVSHRVWAKIGALLAGRTQDPEPAEYHKAVKAFHQYVVARYLELIDTDIANPFGFLTKLSGEEQARILEAESPFNLATICVYLEDEQKAELLDRVSEDARQATLIQLSRLKDIPFELVSSMSERLKLRLKEHKEKPSMALDGQKYLVELLSKLDVESEHRFLDRLKVEQPNEFNLLRRNYLLFDDILFVPAEVLGEATNSMDLKVFTIAVSGQEMDVRSYLLSTLPEKKARMIEKDIAYLDGISRKAFLSSRRALLGAIRAQMFARDMTMGGLMDAHMQSMQGAGQVA